MKSLRALALGSTAEITLLPVTPLYYSIRIHSSNPSYTNTLIRINI